MIRIVEANTHAPSLARSLARWQGPNRLEEDTLVRFGASTYMTTNIERITFRFYSFLFGVFRVYVFSSRTSSKPPQGER